MRKNHDRFMNEVKEAVSLPAQTEKALAPESEEDKAMYHSREEVNHCGQVESIDTKTSPDTLTDNINNASLGGKE